MNHFEVIMTYEALEDPKLITNQSSSPIVFAIFFNFDFIFAIFKQKMSI